MINYSEEIKKKLSEAKKGNKNPSYISPLPVVLDTEEKEKDFSYLVGYWIGDGLRTIQNLGFAVRDKKEYIDMLVGKSSKILGVRLKNRYEGKDSCGLFFRKESFLLKERIIEELSEKIILTKHPWHFICGFLDSDGWVSVWDKNSRDNRVITISFCNTNMSYLVLLSYILDSVFIPFDIRSLNDYKKGYKYSWELIISTYSATYVLSHKLFAITIDDKKKERFQGFIEYFNEKHDKQVIPICETFEGIQGEGKNIGLLQYFIRASTCDMKCVICDSKYSWKGGKNRTLVSLVDECVNAGYKNVCLTGGEIAQFSSRLIALVAMFRVKDFNIVLQTNGLHYHRGFEMIHTVAMDIKTPCTGEKSNENLIYKLDPKKDEVKTLISDIKDYEYALKVNKQTRKLNLSQVLQPCNLVGKEGRDSLIEKYNWICGMALKDKRWGQNIRILPQLHVLIWGNERKK